MYTKEQVCNLGLGLIASSRVNTLSPPRSPLEVYVSEVYEPCKRSELTKRRWVFALVDDYQLTLSETLTTETVDQKPYKYALPSEWLRPVRLRDTEWKQRGRFLYSRHTPLRAQGVMNVSEAEFDPLFVDVLAARIAQACVEYVTQSNSKKNKVDQDYKDAVNAAKQVNAFIIGPEDIGADDSDFSFLTARHT